MKILDITFDLETCDVSPSAAPMQLAALAWDRESTDDDPFLRTSDGSLMSFDERTDLACAVMDGFTFSQSTIDFWSRQKPEVQAVVTDPSRPKLSPQQLYERFFQWITDTKQAYGADYIVLWCQGMDFDIAMMKYAADKFKLKLPVNQYGYRDARTVAFEAAVRRGNDVDDLFHRPKAAPYEYLPPLPDTLNGYSHDALFDCIRTTWSTWHLIRRQD
jgi:hypothetical protein